jgi:lipoteichoic acid synthase
VPSVSALISLLVLLTAALVFVTFRARSRCGEESQPPKWIKAVLPCWTVANVLLKSTLATALMSPHLASGKGTLLWSALFLASLASLFFFLPQRWADLACWTIAALVSLLFWGDVLYYRQFEDFLMTSHFVYLWESQHQGPAAAASLQLGHLIQSRDLALWVDLPIAFLLLWLIPRATSQTRRTLWAVPLVLAPLFLLSNLLWLTLTGFANIEFVTNRLYNRSHVQRHGLVVYHLYDLYHWVRPRLAPPPTLPDDIIRDRLALSARTIGPDTPHFGCTQKANVIVVQLESFQYFLIGMEVDGQEVTPFLNSLRSESLYGNALDQTASGSTSDAMFVMLNSLQPPSGGPFCFLFPTISTRAIPRILGERGWYAFHVMSYDGAFWNTRIMGDHFGFEEQLFTSDLRSPARGEAVGWGLSDAALFMRIIDLLKERPEPFFCYVTTTMMHYPFQELRPHQKLIKLPSHLQQTMAGQYIQLARFRDQAMELFVQRLKDEGLWDHTILVLCGDHRSRMPESEFQRLEVPELEPLRNRLPLFIRVPNAAVRGELAELPGQLDVAPTLLHLLGIDDAGQVFLGRNVLAGQHASASPYGYISDGAVGLWGQAQQDRLLRLSDGLELPVTDIRYAPLSHQLKEEIRVSDTLMYGNRILEFSEPY